MNRLLIAAPAGIAVVVMLSPALARWVPIDGYSEGEVVDVSCGGIAGQLGLLSDWSHSVEGANGQEVGSILSEDGEFGVHWNGTQYDYTIGFSDSTLAIAEHAYGYWLGKGAAKFKVELNATTEASGQASRLKTEDLQWWWTPNVRIDDAEPVIDHFDEDGEFISGVEWDDVHDAYEKIDVSSSAAGRPGNPATPHATYNAQVVTNPGGSASGSFDAVTSSFGQSGEVVFIYYVLTGSAGSNCDNANVLNWKLIVRSTFRTSTFNNP